MGVNLHFMNVGRLYEIQRQFICPVIETNALHIPARRRSTSRVEDARLAEIIGVNLCYLS